MSRTHTIRDQVAPTTAVTSPEKQAKAIVDRNVKKGATKAKDFHPETGEIATVADIVQDLDTKSAANYGLAYFDPADLVEQLLSDPTPKSVVMSSMVWAVQGRIAFKLRSIYFGMRKEARAVGTIDAFNEFTSALTDAAGGEDFVRDLGYANFSEDLSALRALDSVYRAWVSTAEQVTKASGGVFRSPDIFTLLAETMPINADEQKKLILGTRMMLESSGADAATVAEAEANVRSKMLAEYMQRKEDDRIALPSLRALHGFALGGASDARVEFWQLPIDIQRPLIQSTQRAAIKAKDTLAKYRSFSVVDYVMAIPELKRLETALTAVLAADRYQVQ